MTRFPTTIDRYMSSVLVTTEPGWPLRDALRLMREHEFRHLPVVQDGRIAGIVALHAAERALAANRRAGEPIEIAAAMDPRPYVVDPEEPADRVARGMARRRSDCALVAHEGRLLGMFTATDALLALAALLEDEAVPGEAPPRKVVGTPTKSAPRTRARTAKRAAAATKGKGARSVR